MKHRHALLFVLCAGLAQSAAAQTASGTWRGEYDAGVSGTGDRVRVTRRAAIVLILEQKGDSVFGTWDGQPQPPVRELRGSIAGQTLRFTTGTREAEVLVNGKPERRKVRTDFTGTIQSDQITGTMIMYWGSDDPPLRNWSASRVKQ